MSVGSWRRQVWQASISAMIHSAHSRVLVGNFITRSTLRASFGLVKVEGAGMGAELQGMHFEDLVQLASYARYHRLVARGDGI